VSIKSWTTDKFDRVTSWLVSLCVRAAFGIFIGLAEMTGNPHVASDARVMRDMVKTSMNRESK
jgi:hypothetical protein